MSIRKDLKEIKSTLKEITKGALYKSKKYDELQNYLKSLKLKIKNAKIVFLENGTFGVEINYEMAPVIIQYDKTTNEWFKNNTFYSINKLNLISFKEMYRLKQILDEAAKKNNIEGGKNE